ncbi:MAG: type II toxin-antitoxin system PemK/MazF family toxin [bacterium]|nr:type II toxin-antitoxin system PemK/MazF family toxin [bacterium]
MKTDSLKEKILQWFLDWAKLKPRIHFTESDVYFKERQIWWASIGQNIGSEENGKHGNFERPVIIFKKFNPQTFLAVPISTHAKEGAHRLVFINNDARFIANLSQMRVLSSKRLLRFVRMMPSMDYKNLIKMYRGVL